MVTVFLCYCFDKSAFQITEEKMKKTTEAHIERKYSKNQVNIIRTLRNLNSFSISISVFFILFICFLCSNSFLFHVHLNRVFKYTSIKSIEVAQKQTEQEHSLLWCFVCLIYLKRFSINVLRFNGQKNIIDKFIRP